MTYFRDTAAVLSQEQLDDQIYSLWIEAGRIAEIARPGQFLNLYCRSEARLLPRPISLCEIDPASGRLRLVYRTAGAGTREFSSLKTGDRIDILGPLGNGFPTEHQGRALIIGGGIGVPPLLELARQLPGEKTLVMGYRSRPYLKEELSAAGPLCIASEDGSNGVRGNVMDAVREYQLQADTVYACGPLPMLRAVKSWSEERGITAWISLEERMACGIGACLGCVCRTKKKDEHSQVHNARVCREGPVFPASEVEL